MTDHPPPPPEAPHRPYVDDDSLRADLRRVTVLANDRKVMIDRLRRKVEMLERELAGERAAHVHTIREHGLLTTRRWFWK